MPLSFVTWSSVGQHAKSGRLRPLGVTTVKRSPALPDLPAIAETLAGFDLPVWYGVVAPANVPGAILTRLHSEFTRILNSAEFKTWLHNQGAESSPSTPDKLAAQIKRELALYGPIIRRAGMKAD